MALGPHKIEYEVIAGWEQMPEGWSFIEVAGVACDSRDNVYVFNRGEHPMIVFDKEGKFLNAWGAGAFVGPHGIFIDHNDQLWLADDKNHVVHKYTPDGKKLMTIGEPGKSADTGYKIGESPVKKAAGPFNRVTNVAVLPSGDMYIADGYGNARVHKYSADGKLLFSWGEQAAGRASSFCRTASPWTARDWSTSPTAKIRACRFFLPPVNICASGLSSTALTTFSSTTRTCCTSPKAASSTTCTNAPKGRCPSTTRP